ncbi:MAG: hypothetical protein GXP03_07635 [Alphaproteobacteria bacterium]|nr:hypothetical protein [Alphaproteobacteria bacterium]
MSAFAAAMDAIFQDQNMAVEATWTPQGGVPLPVRVIRKAPDELTSFGAARILSDTTLIDVRVSSEMPSVKSGDTIIIGADTFTIQGEPKRDRERLIWALELVPA